LIGTDEELDNFSEKFNEIIKESEKTLENKLIIT